MRETLAPYTTEGLVTVTDMREVLLFSVKMWGQPLAIADCIQRNRYRTKWLLMTDLDEDLFVPSPQGSLHALLGRYAHAPWLTFGTLEVDIRQCIRGPWSRGGSEHFAVEAIVVPAKQKIYCAEPKEERDTCRGVMGHRKYILDPRQVEVASTHRIFSPPNGVNLNATSELRQFHFRGLGSRWKGRLLCNSTTDLINKGAGKGATLRSPSFMAKAAPLIRQCPIGSPKNCFKLKWTKRAGLPSASLPTGLLQSAQVREALSS
eukprot:TRINITY_DN2481_c0_g1_i3.p1 TRINITY_DN2481_c0_g1~~TRINITY_DN2481_c0_g1_i3.p1  ORF type:complete len:262 (-),score=36.70 TRINITY_DN2481_c0_g1_i3:932-1717(-)